MKEKVIIKSKVFPSVVFFLAVISAIFFYASRAQWIFVDIVVKIDGFMFYLLYAMVANAVLSGVLAALRLYEVKRNGEPVCEKKGFSVLTVLSAIFSVFSFIVATIYVIVLAGKESFGVYSLNLKNSLYDAAFLVLVPFLAIFFPLLKGKIRKGVLAVVLAIVMVIGICLIFPVGVYEITSNPTVIDTGENYSVVFSTSDFGTGYVEYTYNGKDYKVYDNTAGRLNTDSKIHSVNIPYEHLNNNTYNVGSVRVIEQYSYGSRLGKEVVSEDYTFAPTVGADVTYLVISDWHTEIERVYDAVEQIGDFDAVLLMGDASPGLDFEDEAVRNIVELSGKVTEGKMPVIFARGNHETRGGYAGKLSDALGLKEFYYTVDTDNYSFIVLDSGEDKDDSHPEYGGMTDYNTYRAEMVEWLKKTEVKNDKVIVLSHSWQVSDVEKDLSQAAWNEFDRLGAKLVISGHSHDCRLLGGNETEDAMISTHPNITGYMDGGNREDKYVASKMTLSNENIYIEAYDHFGEKVFEHTINW